MTKLLALLLVSLLCIWIHSTMAVTVTMRNLNHQRTATNLEEKILNSSNVNPRQFGLLFTRDVVGHIYSQVLYVPHLRIPATKRVHNVVFVTTMANNIYAFDADNPRRTRPLWTKNFGPSLPVDDGMIGVPSAHCEKYTDIQIEVGIVSTPVIDVKSKTMYFVTTNKMSHTPYVVKHFLHAIDITTGNQKPNSPVSIEGKLPGNGLGSNMGKLEFLNLKQNQRMSLTLYKGIVYFGFASYCTSQPYHGWIFGYDAITLKQRFIFTTTPNTDSGGVWQTGNGFVIDEKGFVFCITANGHFDGQTEWSNSYLKMNFSNIHTIGEYQNVMGRDGIVDYFTPFNQQELGELDLDLGTTGPMLIPDTDLLFGCSKQGWCYLVNKENMGGYDPQKNRNVQTFQPNPNAGTEYWTLSTGTHGNACTWHSSTKGRLVFVWPINDSLRALRLKQEGRLGTFDLENSDRAPDMPTGRPLFPGGVVTCSGDHNKKGTGVVWATHALEGSANREIRPGIVRAFDAEDITRELWNSNQVPVRDSLRGKYAKFNPPVAINGKVYVATWSMPPDNKCKLHVYGLLPGRH